MTVTQGAGVLGFALLTIAGGLTLIAVGVVLDPPLALLRYMHESDGKQYQRSQDARKKVTATKPKFARPNKPMPTCHTT